MEMENLRENIIMYRNTKDKAILEELYNYFKSYIKNISKKIFSYEYNEIDLTAKFLDVITKLKLKKYSDDEIQGVSSGKCGIRTLR